MIIYATGFDAVTGAFDRIDIRGRGGRRLREKWADGPRTYLGLQIEGFPNLFTLVGPHNAATFCNIPRCIEQNVEWLTELVVHMRKNGLKRVENTVASEEAWAKHIEDTANATLFPTVNSWFMGVNENIPGLKRQFVAYAGGFPNYRKMCADVAAKGYEGFVLS
jgi:cation diffusion facilitator CzcD-associated flavoprotein CzcO